MFETANTDYAANYEGRLIADIFTENPPKMTIL